MGYIEEINALLVPCLRQAGAPIEEAVVLDLFAGCGGLSPTRHSRFGDGAALDFEAAGYKTIGFEMNPGSGAGAGSAAASYRHNLGSECYAVKLEVGFDFPQADIVIGGPPCQPFSVGGNQRKAVAECLQVEKGRLLLVA